MAVDIGLVDPFPTKTVDTCRGFVNEFNITLASVITGSTLKQQKRTAVCLILISSNFFDCVSQNYTSEMQTTGNIRMFASL